MHIAKGTKRQPGLSIEDHRVAHDSCAEVRPGCLWGDLLVTPIQRKIMSQALAGESGSGGSYRIVSRVWLRKITVGVVVRIPVPVGCLGSM